MSAWAVRAPAPKVSLADIMSEETVTKLVTENIPVEHDEDADLAFALKLQQELNGGDESDGSEESVSDGANDVDMDFALALALQEEEDRQRTPTSKAPSHFSKITLSSSPLPRLQYHTPSHGRAEAEQLSEQLTSGSIVYRGGVAQLADGTYISKHNSLLDGLENSANLSALEGMGDLDTAGYLIDNTIANSLRSYTQKSKRKGISTSGRISRDAHTTSEGVLDTRTRLMLYKMIQRRDFDHLNGVVKTGKESHVYHAECDEPNPRQLAVKVFKTTLNEFHNRQEYFDGDHRFAKKKFMKGKQSAIINKWVEKEYRNLIRAYKAGIPAPEPVKMEDHILLMSYIGGDAVEDSPDTSGGTCRLNPSGRVGQPAPQLRELSASITEEQWTHYYLQTLTIAHDLYVKCNLVHGDMSEYNLLLHDDRVHVIDFGQAVDLSHPSHKDFLRRDLHTIGEFFGRKGVSVLSDSVAVEVVMNPRASLVTIDERDMLNSFKTHLNAREVLADIVQAITHTAHAVIELSEGFTKRKIVDKENIAWIYLLLDGYY